VGQYLERVQPREVWDLGANVGLFSRFASERGIDTIAFDIDPAAVEINYQNCVAIGETHLLPLLMDLTNPSPALGWQHRERMSLVERGPAHLVMGLALIHHLAISNNVPLADLASFFGALTEWMILEWVPKEDPQVQRLLATRADIFPQYDQKGFERAFTPHFDIVDSSLIETSTRVLYLMRANS
jgi:ribosomal protein L11 methylase PrmA